VFFWRAGKFLQWIISHDKKIVLQNFYSFGQSQIIELNEDVNILIGINGTGKSNFIKAIQLLYESIVGEGMEKLFSQNWGGFSNVVNFHEEDISEISIEYEFNYQSLLNTLSHAGFQFKQNPYYKIVIKKRGLAEYSLSECFYVKNDNGKTFTYLTVENGKAFISERSNRSIELRRYEVLNQNELVLKQISDPDRYYPLYTLKMAIEQIAVYTVFDTTPQGKIRQLSPYYSDKKLLSNGYNLAHLLNFMSANHSKHYELIVKHLNKINSNFKELVFTAPTAGKTLLSLKEKELCKAISIDNISDGTLRFLLLLAIFYNPNRGKLICIDEPETGLHPDMINSISEGIKHAAKNGTQMIIATHSPLLLNSFELEDLSIFEKDKKNQSAVKIKSEEDFADWEGDFLVGQMWLRGLLGGTRW
jgi:predicted ATPase